MARTTGKPRPTTTYRAARRNSARFLRRVARSRLKVSAFMEAAAGFEPADVIRAHVGHRIGGRVYRGGNIPGSIRRAIQRAAASERRAA